MGNRNPLREKGQDACKLARVGAGDGKGNMQTTRLFKAYRAQLEELPDQASALGQSPFPLKRGIYTVFRIYPGRKVLRFREHVDRLAHSAELFGMPFRLNEPWLRRAIYRAVAQTGADSLRARIAVPRNSPDTLIIALEPFRPIPEETYKSGVHVGLVMIQRDHPTAKDTRFIEFREKLRQQHPEVYEILIQSNTGKILEGMSSNFYAIRGGVLHTAGENILPGISRSILLQIAPMLLEVSFDPIYVSDLASLDEALLTSASRGVLPVVQIAGHVIADGNPGPVTMQLRRRFESHVQAELEPLLPERPQGI